LTEAPKRRGIPLRAVAPNAVTALALCSGLTGVRFAIAADWERAAAAIIIAGILDGLDGRIARLLKGQSKFGEQLDSLSDVIAFGVAPALIMFLWSLKDVPRYGWIFALALAVCMAMRLARFNSQIDDADHPRKSAGFLTGVPAPAAAGLAMLPLYISLWAGNGPLQLPELVTIVRNPFVVAPWLAFVAFLAVSSVATFSWSSLRIRRSVRIEALVVVALLGAAILSAPWETLTLICVVYLGLIAWSVRAYAKVKRRRGAQGG
jgi:CDP-diacylglycerol---serine O-phosphatidyltransferase